MCLLQKPLQSLDSPIHNVRLVQTICIEIKYIQINITSKVKWQSWFSWSVVAIYNMPFKLLQLMMVTCQNFDALSIQSHDLILFLFSLA